MSTWVEIIDKDEIEYDAHCNEIDVCYSSDKFGNNYVSIPVDIILEKLREQGCPFIKSIE